MNYKIEYDISIIIVNYNTYDLLDQCLQSIQNYQWNVKIEIIVVDNNSGDKSCEIVRNNYPDVVLIENTENAGYTKANNQGIEISKGKYILLLNSDTLVTDGALNKLVLYLDEHADVGIVGCKLLNDDGSLQHYCSFYPTLKTEFASKIYLHKIMPWTRWAKEYINDNWRHDTDKSVDWVTGAALLTRREIIDDIGGLDEKIYMFYEDAEFCLRTRNAGWDVRHIPDAVIIHLWGGSWKKNRAATIVNNFVSACYFFRKHCKSSHVKIYKLMILVECFIRIPIFTFMALWEYEKRLQWINRLEGYEELLKRWWDA